ncbi:MAG TPA: response regulator [Vicinamibacterales bacterium]|nr:response regulator [Vicinamibacterales bacterium]
MPGAEANRGGISRVLLVEDHADTRQMYAEFLGMEFEVVTAANGEDALKRMRTEVPHLIVTDLSLPVMDGFELVTQVRRDARLQSIPIICLSGYGGHEHEQRARAAGCDRILQKPCMPDELAAIVSEELAHAAKRRKNA